MKFSYPQLKKFLINQNLFGKTLWFLGKHAFLVILLLVVFSIALGGFLFYNYVVIIENNNPVASQTPFRFRDDIYQSVLVNWHTENQEINYEEYSNPF